MTAIDKVLHRTDKPGMGGEVAATEIRQDILRDQMEPLGTDAAIDLQVVYRAIVSAAISLKRLADAYDHDQNQYIDDGRDDDHIPF